MVADVYMKPVDLVHMIMELFRPSVATTLKYLLSHVIYR